MIHLYINIELTIDKKYKQKTYSEINKSLLSNYLIKKTTQVRNKFFYTLKKETKYSKYCSLIDIGTSSSADKIHNNILRLTTTNNNIDCLSNLDLKKIKKNFQILKNL
jgi:hypothetical protein